MHKKKKWINKFLWILLPLLLIFIILIFYSLQYHFHKRVENIKLSELKSLEYQTQMIDNTIDAIIREIIFLSKNEDLLKIFTTNKTVSELSRLKEESEFFRLVSSKKIYDQIRLLSKTGMELIRINYNNDNPLIIRGESLQDKSNRYYFKETMKLSENEIFVSPFDLNIENGSIELPIKPMIRFGIPIISKNGDKKGVIIINYLGEDFIDKLEKISSINNSEMLLANNVNQWIVGPDSAKNWDFMYNAKSDFNLKNSFPQQFDHINTKTSGQFSEDNFIYTFWKVSVTKTNSLHWILFSRKKIDNEKRTMTRVISTTIILLVLLSIIFLILFIKLSRAVEARRISEKKMIQARYNAERADASKSIFLAHMSHEIRNPMNAIIGLNQLLSTTDLTEKQKDYVHKAGRSSKDLLQIINDILDISKIEAGKMDLEQLDFNIVDLINDIVDLISIQIESKNLHIQKNIDSDIPEIHSGDPLRLKQILTNLLSNAIKFTTEGMIEVNCSLKDKTADQCILYFSVKDSGEGMTEEQQKKLFQTFSQADNSISRTHGGSGLGLKICKQLIEKMEGEIGVESTHGAGSTFWFTVKLKLATGIIVESDDEKVFNNLRGLKILVVEDNEINQFVIKEILENQGIYVTPAYNGFDAIKIAAENDFNLILMDIQMPGMDGYETTATLKQRHNEIPVIALTADSLKDEGVQYIESGIDDYLLKPLILEDLLLIIEKWAYYRHLNIVQAMNRLNGNRELYNQLLKILKNKLNSFLKLIENGSFKNEPQLLKQEIHKLKGSAIGLGAERFHNIAGKLEMEMENNSINKKTIMCLIEEINFLLKEI